MGCGQLTPFGMGDIGVLIVGSEEDPHVQVVEHRVAAAGKSAIVVDASSLAAAGFSVTPATITLAPRSDAPRVLRAPARGWCRRLAPAEWYGTARLGSRDAAVKSAWLALTSALGDCAHVEWLSTPGAIIRAENKLVQYAAATEIGIPIPRTVVASDVSSVEEDVGASFVVKPLGAGQFRSGDREFAVFATEKTANDNALKDLGGAPFIAQERIQAVRHLRVVTVGDEAWVSALDARDLPLDWRTSAPAHAAFVACRAPSVGQDAVRLTKALDIRFSSQDWIESRDAYRFLDLNPAGQWLFLPTEVASAVTDAIADWLSPP